MLKLKASIPILDESNTATHVGIIGIWRDCHFHELHIFPCWGHTDKIYCHELSWITELWDQIFPHWWCCWGHTSSGMWACLAGLIFTDISKEHHPQPLKMKVLLSFETLSNTNPAVQYHIPEDLDSQTYKTSCTWVRLILSYKWVVAYLSQDWSWLGAAVWFLSALPGLQAARCCCCFQLWLGVPLCTAPPRTPNALVSPPPHLTPGHHWDCKYCIFIFLAGFEACALCIGHTRVINITTPCASSRCVGNIS